MIKYIDADKLKAEIDNLESFSCISEEQDGFYSAISRINDIIDALQQEQPYGDLKKEIDRMWNPRFNLGWDDNSLLSINHKSFEAIASHFYKLGINARNED